MLRDDYGTTERMPDLGYPRARRHLAFEFARFVLRKTVLSAGLAEKDDGTFVCMYYWATAELQRQHIAATTFGPPGRAAL